MSTIEILKEMCMQHEEHKVWNEAPEQSEMAVAVVCMEMRKMQLNNAKYITTPNFFDTLVASKAMMDSNGKPLGYLSLRLSAAFRLCFRH